MEQESETPLLPWDQGCSRPQVTCYLNFVLQTGKENLSQTQQQKLSLLNGKNHALAQYESSSWRISTTRHAVVLLPRHLSALPCGCPLRGSRPSSHAHCSCWWSSRALHTCRPAPGDWCPWPGSSRRLRSPGRCRRTGPSVWPGLGRSWWDGQEESEHGLRWWHRKANAMT